MSVRTRVAQLEKRATPGTGGLAIVLLTGDDRQPLPAEEQARLLAEARAEVGASGLVVAIKRGDDRRP